MASCPLCHTSVINTFHINTNATFYNCGVCGLLFKHLKDFPSATEEKNRYLRHNNNPTDKGYQQFVLPMVTAIQNDFSIESKGLDFGAGTGPVVTKMLSEKGFSIILYDTFFHPNQNALKQQYDFIICCEVMEHFHHPDEEFSLLKKLLKPNGKLYCMTEMYSETIDFETWYYKNDKTHVVFYTKKTISWIQQTFNFSEVKANKRLIVFSA